MNKITIKVKLVLLFIIIKVLPLCIIAFLSYEGITSLNSYMKESTTYLSNQSKEIILNTANKAIEDSIRNLDKKSQTSFERLTLEIANNISSFLKQRDNDILFLSKVDISDNLLKEFYNTKLRDVVVQGDYIYNESKQIWENLKKEKYIRVEGEEPVVLQDNKRSFNYILPSNIKTKKIPIYKEISFFNMDGIEKYKISSLSNKKLDISIKSNTFINSENYFNKINSLKKGEIYVSDVIGEYVGTKIIGVFSKQNAKKSNIEFEPQKYAYAGKENPLGKRFDGIIRFVTPVFKENKKIGYISMALDHRHIMEFTDSFNPVGDYTKANISDASVGNYAFLLDYKGRNISHSRDYFITGFDKETGKRVAPWVSLDVAKKFEESGVSDLNEFLETYPKFQNQTLSKKPNISQLLVDGKVPVHCEYLNFAPHCHGWMEVTKNGGHGSFVLYWSGVWKLVTAAPIPYSTGQYKNSKRGFGFVTIGANVDEFHAAANKTKENINHILETQNRLVKGIVDDNTYEINRHMKSLLNDLTFVTFFMIIIVIAIAIWMSNYISSKIENLLIGTQKFSQNELDYKINVSSDDEIGNLEKSFNQMASKINKLIIEQNELNEHLEDSVKEKTKELLQINESLEIRVKQEVNKNRQKDAQLIQNNKMATLGEMISMIIHQWKQPLTAISMINSSQELRLAIGQNTEEELHRDNTAIKKQIELMIETMNDFRNFFKNTQKSEYEIDPMIKKSINLIQNIYKYEGIFIDYQIDKQLKTSKTLGYENEIIQVLINILNNSRDAIIENNSQLRKIEIKVFSKNDEIHISVQDFAGGIKDELQSKIFNAYFTTKSEDKGTGLGLYMSKTILKKVGGDIVLENNDRKIDNILFKGVKFTIKLKRK